MITIYNNKHNLKIKNIYVKAKILKKYIKINISLSKCGLIFSERFLKKQGFFKEETVLKKSFIYDYIIRYIEIWCFELGFVKYKKNKLNLNAIKK